MQWLIDLVAEKVIAEIGIPPVYIHRGDPAGHDFNKFNLTIDGAWHDFDLSAIVPAGAKAIHLRVGTTSMIVPAEIEFRQKGNVNLVNIFRHNTQIAGVQRWKNGLVGCDENRIIQYWVANHPWMFIYISICGWVL